MMQYDLMHKNDRCGGILYDENTGKITDCGMMQDFMDYQTLTDFIISNTDEHLLNFGVLRNPDSMELIGPAPIFDSGNSMFYSEDRRIPYTRAGILDRKITSFYEKEEKLLKRVQNRNMSCS